MLTFFRYPVITVAAAATFGIPTSPCAAQSLDGSNESINRMYRRAHAERLSFYETGRGVRRAVDAGRLERLIPDGNFTLHEVEYPFGRPTTLTFVQRLGVQYHAECDEPLEVTSAGRPARDQPANSVTRSVHPTGMAIDLHKPTEEKCKRWLREMLLDLEAAGVIEATEEFAPPHFHVAVYPTAYRRYVEQRTRLAQAARPTANPSSPATTYRVRPGDTLWEIARLHDTTVGAIRTANRLESTAIQAGDTLLIPRRR